MATTNYRAQSLNILAPKTPVLTPQTPKTPAPVVAPKETVAQTYARGQAVIAGFQKTGTPVVPATTLGNTKPVTIPTTPKPIPATTPTVPTPTGTTTDATTGVTTPTPPAPTETNAQSNYQKMLEKLSGFGEQLAGKADATAKLQEEQQLAQKTEQATKDYNAYNSKKLEYEQTIARMKEENPRGMLEGGMNNEINTYSRRANADLANLAMQAQISQGLESAARQTIKDSIEAQFQPIEDQIDFYTKFAQLNQNDLSESQMFELQELSAQKKAETANVQSVANELGQAFLGDTVAQSAINKVIQDYTAGKITAQDATAQMYGAVGTPQDVLLDREAKRASINATNRSNQGTGGGTGTGGGGSVYSNDLDAIIGTVLSIIPSKFGQQTFNTQIDRARDDADKLNIVAAQVLQGQPAEFKNDFRNQAVGIAEIDKAINALDEGVQTGVLQNGAQYAANFFGKDYDPKLAAINGYITSAIQPYRNSVTGAAWGDQEDGEYQQLFGTTKYSPTELRQRLVQTKELLKTKSSEGLNSFVNPLGSYENRFNTGTLTPASPIAPQPTDTPVARGFWGSIGNFLWGND